MFCHRSPSPKGHAKGKQNGQIEHHGIDAVTGNSSQILISETPEEFLMQTFSTFTVFQLLPAELRIKIWKHALPGPRAITVSLPRFQIKYSYLRQALRANALPTELLLVNQEARRTFQEEYQELFQSCKWGYYFRETDGTMTYSPKWYFSYEKDTLCIASGLKGLSWFLKMFPKEMAMIRYLDVAPDGHAIHTKSPFRLAKSPERVMDMKALNALNSLKVITIRDIESPSLHPPRPWIKRIYSEDTIEAVRLALNGHDDRAKPEIRLEDVDLVEC